MPVQDGDETYAIAVTATSEHPNCIALCIQTKLEELYASGIVDRSANHRPAPGSSWPPTTAPTRTCRA